MTIPSDSNAADFGTPPTLAWLPVEQCVADLRYQRRHDSKASQRVIDRIVAEFRWSAFQAVLATASDEVEGEWKIIDGMHRTAAAKRLGITHIPAVVAPAISLADQADAFARANCTRASMNAFALHHARVVAGNLAAREIDDVCLQSGISLPRYALRADMLKPGQTLALGTIAVAVKHLDKPTLVNVLRTLTTSWRGKPGVLRASIIRAVCEFIRERPAAQRQTAIAWLGKYLTLTRPSDLFAQGMKQKLLTDGSSDWRALVFCLNRQYQKHLGAVVR